MGHTTAFFKINEIDSTLFLYLISENISQAGVEKASKRELILALSIMEKKNYSDYQSPEVETMEVSVEKGFAVTNTSENGNPTDGGPIW